MPVRKNMQYLYPENWKEISYFVRFIRENGRCQNCERKHGEDVIRLNDGRWFDSSTNKWLDKHGKLAKWPDIFDFQNSKKTKVILAAAHIEHDPRINGDEFFNKLAAWCQRCHIIYDRPYHMQRRRLNYRAKLALGDFFSGNYEKAMLRFDTISRE